MKYRYIVNDAQFSEYLEELKEKQIREIGLDLEGDYNLHSFGEKLCLIQIYDNNIPVIIDPFLVSPKLMKKFFENRRYKKIMFDSSSDQRLMYKVFKIRIFNIIDLKPAVDLLEYPKRNLGYLLMEKIGLEPFDKKSFQKYNWQSRPIDKDCINYAISDVLYLFTLKDLIFAEMTAFNMMDEYKIRNKAIQISAPKINTTPTVFRKLLFISLKARQKEIFKEIYWIREAYAKRLDIPAFHLLSNEKLRKIVVKPKTIMKLETRMKIAPNDLEKLRSEIEAVQVRAQAKADLEVLDLNKK